MICSFLRFAVITILFSSSCNSKSENGIREPRILKDGWISSTPELAGFDKYEIEKFVRKIPDANPKLDAILIARHGKLIVDEYFNGYIPEKLHPVWSVTKTITGTLIGIAKDKGLLTEKDSIIKYVGGYETQFTSDTRGITIEHLLTMRSGFEWKELGGKNSAGYMLPYSPDWIEFTLAQPHVIKPGLKFNYSTGNTILLAPVIQSATGLQARDFADEHLFQPLGIIHYEWDKQSEFWTNTQRAEIKSAVPPPAVTYKKPFADLTNTGSGLRLRPRDVCKIGQLYLNQGQWNGKQIVSESWVTASTQQHSGNEYGYLWRLMQFEGQPCYYATGFGLQRIFVFPSLDLVIVLMQQHYDTMPEGENLTISLLHELLKAISR